MSREAHQWVENQLQALAASLPSDLEWKWDGRFGTALAEFSTDKASKIRVVLEEALTACWDASNWKQSPAPAQSVIKMLGGLMPEQYLHTVILDSSACVFCAWWPWGSGTKISIRIAAFGLDLADQEATRREVVLRDTFRI